MSNINYTKELSNKGQKYFGWADYKYGNGTSEPGTAGMTKYNSTDGKTVLDLEDDAVNAAWAALGECQRRLILTH